VDVLKSSTIFKFFVRTQNVSRTIWRIAQTDQRAVAAREFSMVTAEFDNLKLLRCAQTSLFDIDKFHQPAPTNMPLKAAELPRANGTDARLYKNRMTLGS
jgi:hypothetical protein